MAIFRYTASADNTITNAFNESILSTLRATGSNSGKADILEVFSIYGQDSSSVGLSSEASRILLKFDMSGIVADRAIGTLPSGSATKGGTESSQKGVKFFLCLYNAPHSETLPQDYKLTIARITNNWEEGFGLDMDNYTDKTFDGEGSNWVNGNGSGVSATATIEVTAAGAIGHGETFVLIDNAGLSTTYLFNGGVLPANGGGSGGSATVGIQGVGGDPAAAADAIKKAINATTDATYTADDDGVSKVTITQGASGYAGNRTNIDSTNGITVSNFTNGNGAWENFGGDFSTASNEFVDVSFPEGDEDIKVDITTIVEKWITGSANGGYDNYGLMIKLSSSLEPHFTASTSATGSQNTSGAKRSYYTKKFFGRGTEFFFKRPTIEARWDDARIDHRGNTFFSSSAAQAGTVAHMNVNKIFMYNYLRGRLQDIGYSSALSSHTGDTPICRIYMSSDGVTPVGHPLPIQGSNYAETRSSTNQDDVRVARGVYKTEFVIKKEQLPDDCPYLVDVWFHEGEAFYTGSIGIPKVFRGSFSNPNPQYIVSMPNLRKQYNQSEMNRFRVLFREKDWSPTIYTVASKEVELVTPTTASYEIYRVIDDQVVIRYGKKSPYSETSHPGVSKERGYTMLSADRAGNYFDLDMKLLEPGYAYGIRLSVYDGMFNSYRELPHTFKFRVKKDEY